MEKKIRKALSVLLSLSLLFLLCACGGEKLVKSKISGAEAQEEFWSTDFDASAARLSEFRAQSPEEVTSIWRQAKIQGNGALLYALYSSSLKGIFLEQIKNNGSWNLYLYTDSPAEVTCSEPEKIEDTDMYVSDVTALKTDGNIYYSQIFIELTDGGYYVVSESLESTTSPYSYQDDVYIDIDTAESTAETLY